MSESPEPTLAEATLPSGWVAVYPAAQPSGYAALTPEQRSHWEAMAAEFLNRWTGQRFGLSEVKLIPCYRPLRPTTFQGLGPRTGGRRWFAYGAPWRLWCSACGQTCSCLAPYGIRLPGPVHEVLEVTIDGVTVAPESYELRRYGHLVRIDGDRWPAFRSLTPRQEHEGLGWRVRYVRGEPLPSAGGVALGILAIEFWKAYAGDRSCQLPTRLSSITREGVSVTVLDTFEDLQEGHTGIWAVDSWIASVIHAPQRPVIASPDVARPRIVP